MRGGALPMLFWGLLLAASGATNAIWTHDWIQSATFGTAVIAILLLASTLIVRSRGEAARRGAPSRRSGLEAVTRTSYGAVIAAVGLATYLFGYTFGHLFIYLGAGLMAAGAARLGVELYSQRRATRRGRS